MKSYLNIGNVIILIMVSGSYSLRLIVFKVFDINAITIRVLHVYVCMYVCVLMFFEMSLSNVVGCGF